MVLALGRCPKQTDIFRELFAVKQMLSPLLCPLLELLNVVHRYLPHPFGHHHFEKCDVRQVASMA